jgi:hypothetical protein
VETIQLARAATECLTLVLKTIPAGSVVETTLLVQAVMVYPTLASNLTSVGPAMETMSALGAMESHFLAQFLMPAENATETTNALAVMVFHTLERCWMNVENVAGMGQLANLLPTLQVQQQAQPPAPRPHLAQLVLQLLAQQELPHQAQLVRKLQAQQTLPLQERRQEALQQDQSLATNS